MSARTLRIAQYLVRTADLKSRIEGILANPQFKGVDPEFLADLASVDPSGNRGDYLTWILKNTRLKDSAQGIAWPEDRERVRRALAGFFELKRQPRYFKKYEASPDINTYKLRTLEALNRKVHGQQQPQEAQEAQESPATETLAKGVTLFYQDNEFKVLRAGGPGTDIDEAVKGLCELGAGTEWCTRDAEAAHSYIERGPVYVIYRNGEKIAQTDVKTLMDVHDNPIMIDESPGLWKKMVQFGIFTPGRFAFEYAKIVKRGRWPEGEKDILNDSTYRLEYLKKYVKHGESWPEAAPYIIRDRNPEEIVEYTLRCLEAKRWPAGEKALLKSTGPRLPEYLLEYAANFIKDRWPAAEPKILGSSDSGIIFRYANHCCHGQRVPEIEKALLESDQDVNKYYQYHLARYAVEVMGERWPEAEYAIVKHGGYAFVDYVNGLHLDIKKFIEEFTQKYAPRKTGSLRIKSRSRVLCP